MFLDKQFLSHTHTHPDPHPHTHVLNVTQYNKRYILSSFEKIEVFASSNRRFKKALQWYQIYKNLSNTFENTSFTKYEFPFIHFIFYTVLFIISEWTWSTRCTFCCTGSQMFWKGYFCQIKIESWQNFFSDFDPPPKKKNTHKNPPYTHTPPHTTFSCNCFFLHFAKDYGSVYLLQQSIITCQLGRTIIEGQVSKYMYTVS